MLIFSRLRCAAVACLCLAQAGCYVKTTDPWSELRRFADPPTQRGELGNGRQGQQQDTGFAVLLTSFAGRDRQQKAQQYIADLFRKAQLSDLWFRSVGDRALVYRGRYPDPQDPAAQRDLYQTRITLVDDELPFENVTLVSLGLDAQTPAGEHDLRRFPGRYSLQIGYYDERYNGADYRKAAEDAVKRLREDGDEAYYYHGPTMSMVMLGLFGNDDIQQRVTNDANGRQTIEPIYSEAVMQLQQRFPYNASNGQDPRMALPGQTAPPQPSFLVRVPY
jgi:hypothetical protein